MRTNCKKHLLASAVALFTAAAGMAMAQDGPIRIGVLNDQSGPYADASGEGSVVMARLALEDFGGSVMGRPVEILSADHRNSADVGSTQTRRWLDVDGVDAIFDVPNSGVLLALQEVVRERGGILMASGGGTSAFTAAACSPYGFQWTYDTFALANGAVRALAREGLDSWFLLQVDYAFGEAAAADIETVLNDTGGQILGRVRTPLNTADFSSFLLQAQASGAQAIALLNAGADTLNSIKQANEFGIPQSGQQLVGLIFFETDALGVGIDVTQGLSVTVPFYWNQSDEARAVSERFYEQIGRMPSYVQIGVYSSVMHYLRALEHAGTTDRDAVADAIRELDVNDAFVVDGTVRADGRMLHTMLLGQVRTPAEMEGQHNWDIYNILAEIPAEESARPLPVGECAMLDG